jgi:hypothetical protein
MMLRPVTGGLTGAAARVASGAASGAVGARLSEQANTKHIESVMRHIPLLGIRDLLASRF